MPRSFKALWPARELPVFLREWSLVQNRLMSEPARRTSRCAVKACYDERIGGISRGPPLLSRPDSAHHKPKRGTGRRRSRMVQKETRGPSVRAEAQMKPTDISSPDYFHKVVDCQWACPAHTPVPEYIRLIAAG